MEDRTIEILSDQIRFLYLQLEKKDEEIKRLTNIILASQGLGETKIIVPNELPPNLQEIPNKKQWPALRRELEKKYSKVKSGEDIEIANRSELNKLAEEAARELEDAS